MLKHLSIKDFVIVNQITLDFQSGFTVLTGETGAGKSILIDALSLAMGARGDANQVRHDSERAEISAVFDVSALPQLVDWLETNELQGDPDTCLLRRIVDANGRSRGFVNGHAVTLLQMRAVGEQLVDIHGQHAHQSLLNTESQRTLFDAYAGNVALVKAVADAYHDWQKLYHQRLNWEKNTADNQQEREQLTWQCEELTDLHFSAEEWQALQTDHSRLSHVASLLEAAEMGLEILSENDSSAISQINAVNSQLLNLQDFDPALKAIIDQMDSAQAELQEGIYELNHYRQSLDLDPQLLQETEARMADILAAARKYRVAPDELPDFLESLTQRLAAIGASGDLDQLVKDEAAAKEAYLKVAKKLSAKRKKTGQILSQKVSESMHTLAMEEGQFSVTLMPLEQGASYGLEQVEFQVSTHKGLPLKPLAKVVSGGELSRISLAIQVITSQVGTAPTLIFDEVDSGIGGRVAEIVGDLLKALGKTRQVLCITHLPQVAVTGDQQWQVSKLTGQTKNKHAISQITVLDEQERVAEIARMLGGVKITATTRQHATEMLQKHSK